MGEYIIPDDSATGSGLEVEDPIQSVTEELAEITTLHVGKTYIAMPVTPENAAPGLAHILFLGNDGRFGIVYLVDQKDEPSIKKWCATTIHRPTDEQAVTLSQQLMAMQSSTLELTPERYNFAIQAVRELLTQDYTITLINLEPRERKKEYLENQIKVIDRIADPAPE